MMQTQPANAVDRDVPLYQQWKASGLNYREYYEQQQHAIATTYHGFRARMWRVHRQVQYTSKLWESPIVDKEWVMHLDSFVCVSDIHVPTTDFEFAMLPAMVAEKNIKRGKRTLIIAGDLFNMNAFSRHDRMSSYATFSQEKRAARELIQCYLGTFDAIKIFRGNHEDWFIRHMQAESTMQDLMEQVIESPKVQVSNFSYMRVYVPKTEAVTNKWTLTHTPKYSRGHLKVASDVALAEQTNVIQMHEHRIGIAFDPYGRYMIINNGGLYEDTKMDYVTRDLKAMPKMIKGFSANFEGYPVLYSNMLTNWKKAI